MSEYINKLIESFQRAGMADIKVCTEGIEISEGYDSYSRAMQTYHEIIRREVPEDGTTRLQEILDMAK